MKYFLILVLLPVLMANMISCTTIKIMNSFNSNDCCENFHGTAESYDRTLIYFNGNQCHWNEFRVSGYDKNVLLNKGYKMRNDDYAIYFSR